MIKILVLVLFGALTDCIKIKDIPTLLQRQDIFANNGRIVGGKDCTYGEIPYIVSVRWGNDESHICGGSILNDSVILCAAHCSDGKPSDYKIVAGEWSIKNKDDHEQMREVSRIEVHNEYDDNTLINDIALLFLKDPLEFNVFVQPVFIPKQGMISTGNAVASGWGITRENGNSISDILQKVSLTLLGRETCKKILPYGEEDLKAGMICAWHQPGGIDSCNGDSGGPLMATHNGKTYQCGIVSWGYGCARPNMPGVYTEVSYYVDWIEKYTTPSGHNGIGNLGLGSLSLYIFSIILYFSYCLKYNITENI